jgi:hypothetical protein
MQYNDMLFKKFSGDTLDGRPFITPNFCANVSNRILNVSQNTNVFPDNGRIGIRTEIHLIHKPFPQMRMRTT